MKTLDPYKNEDAIHPDFKMGTRRRFPLNDIAILELPKPLVFHMLNKHIRPLCLPSRELNTDSDVFGKPLKAVVAGWGRRGVNSRPTGVLRAAELTVMTNKACNTMLPLTFGNSLQPFHLCAYSRGNGPCLGDGGAALFTRRPADDEPTWRARLQLIGIASQLNMCDTVRRPSGFTRASFYVDWIIEKMMETSSRKKVTVCAGTFGKFWRL